MQEDNQTGLQLFEIGDTLVFSDSFPRKDSLSKLLPLRFVKYNSKERQLCLCLDNEGDFITLYREFLVKVKNVK